MGSSKPRIVEWTATLAGFIGFDVGAAAVVQSPSNIALRNPSSNSPAWILASCTRLLFPDYRKARSSLVKSSALRSTNLPYALSCRLYL